MSSILYCALLSLMAVYCSAYPGYSALSDERRDEAWTNLLEHVLRRQIKDLDNQSIALRNIKAPLPMRKRQSMSCKPGSMAICTDGGLMGVWARLVKQPKY